MNLAPLILLVTQGCEQQPQRFSDNTIQEFREGMPGITEGCLNKIKHGGIEAMPSSTDECFEMTPTRQWKGLWRREFENSRFCPSPAGSCSYQTAGDRIWLSGKALTSSASDEGLYEVEFVGRQTARKGSYGHLSAFDYEIIVDKVVNLRLVSDAATLAE
ncbi:hypothetical protein [Sphingobium yanoikuyae]|uniref:hypothetical protein n=1 Tax=Sphingobium yanoikuyae TaxID=13690 RepID=UPI0028A12ADC|nr:hypothetical protein [Sphingobium yanoikuyae]